MDEETEVDNGQKTLSELFARNTFTVPIYQRAYAWDERQCEDFLRDLEEHPHSDPSKRHFLGTVLLAAKAIGDFRSAFDVVDGQQRLTTATIFTIAACDRIAQDESLRSRAEIFRLSLLVGNRGERLFHTILEDEGFLERFILNGEIPSKSDFSTRSKRRLWAAKAFFLKEISSKKPVEADRLLTVLYNSRLLVYSVDTPAEATQIFEFQNDRGKSLTELERLKSFLMHRLYLHSGSTTDTDLDIVQHAFGRIYLAAERFETEPLAPTADAVLSYHCAAFLPWSNLRRSDKELWREPKQLVRELLSNEPLIKDVPNWIKDTAYDLAVNFEAVADILAERYRSDQLGGLFVIGRVAVFWPLLLKTWRQRGNNPKGFDQAVLEMEKLSWRMALANLKADTFASMLRKEAEIFSGNFDRLVSTLQEFGLLHRIPERCIMSLDQDNFYSEGRTCRYLLWRYENHLLSEVGKKEAKLSWSDAAGFNPDPAVHPTLDHIQAQGSLPTVLQRLVVWNPKDPEEQPRPFAQCFLHRLGNLVLDTRSLGASNSNKPFNERVTHYLGSTLRQEHELVNKFAEKLDDGSYIWTDESIRQRHKHLKSFAQKFL